METPKSNTQKDYTNITKYQYENIKVFVKFEKVFGGKDGITKDDDVKLIVIFLLAIQSNDFNIIILINHKILQKI